MSMEFDCDKCGKLSGRYIILCPTCATGNTVGTQPTDVQQLKAEIAALVKAADDMDQCEWESTGFWVIDRLRQLSAI